MTLLRHMWNSTRNTAVAAALWVWPPSTGPSPSLQESADNMAKVVERARSIANWAEYEAKSAELALLNRRSREKRP